MFTLLFWKRATERALRAAAVGFLGTAGVADLFTTGATFGLKERAALAAAQAVGSLLFSLIGSQVGDPTSPSLVSGPSEPS